MPSIIYKRLSLLFVALILSVLQAFCSDYYKVTSNNKLNVRSYPSTSGQIVAQLHPGSTVEVMSINNGWAKVSLTNGRQGYVSANYIRFSHHKNSAPVAQAQTKRVSREWIKAMVDREANWSGWTIFWVIAAIVLATAGIIVFYNYDEYWSFYGSLILLGTFGSVFGAFACGGNFLHAHNWLQLIVMVVVAAGILLSQYWLYASILGSFDWAVDDDECEERVLPLSLGGGALAGVLRAICGLLEWGTSWIDTCLYIGIAILIVFVMISAFRSGETENILMGLATSALVAVVTFFIMFEVAVIVYYTWGLILGILFLAALLSPSGGGSFSGASSGGGGGGGNSDSDAPDPNFVRGANIDWGRSGYYVDSRHFKESNGDDWYRTADGSGWRKC